MPQLSFSNLPKLPREIIDRILRYWIAPQEITLGNDGTLVRYACSTDALAASLPPAICEEYWRVRYLSWLNDAKTFTNTSVFYLAHHILSQHPEARPHALRLPTQGTTIRLSDSVQALILTPHPLLRNHGLEKIILDFEASNYFEMFDVRLPPFDVPSEDDPQEQGIAFILQHCRDLTLVFDHAYRWAHPWLGVDHPNWQEARYRPRVCDMGKVIDMILEAGWRNGYLQHIGKITLEGGIQGWVRTKWERIFAEGVYEARNVRTVERPWEVYPPACECKSGCWEIGVKKMW
ncbi:hypothetical protein HBI47_089490 [Parastagonospora nodorum]|nr:hypothetical protein HBI47_089490 [Parastagonospora nodorum]